MSITIESFVSIVSVRGEQTEKLYCLFRWARKIPPGQVNTLTLRLMMLIIKLFEDGYIYFLTAGALGFDTLAAQVILALRT